MSACFSGVRHLDPRTDINRQGAVPHKTIRAIGASVAAAKDRLNITGSGATASWRADSARIEVVWQSLHDVGRRRN